MSEHAPAAASHDAPPHDAGAHAAHEDPPPTLTSVFNAEEIKAFDEEDTEAGRNICKMLSLFFFYTVIVMGLSTYVTMRWVL